MRGQMRNETQSGVTRQSSRDEFITRVAIVAAAVALLFLAWVIRHALILAFAGVVAAVILSAIADPLRRWTGMSRGFAVLTGMALILLGLGIFGWIAMPAIQTQGKDLIARNARLAG